MTMGRKITGKGQKGIGRTDLERLRRMKDEDIDYSDIPRLPIGFWEESEIVKITFSILESTINAHVSMGFNATGGLITNPNIEIGSSLMPIQKPSFQGKLSPT